jgi:predicted phage tail protein
MKNLTKIKIYGDLAEKVGKDEWNIKINSIAEALFAINILTNDKFRKCVSEEEKNKKTYSLIVNGEEVDGDEVVFAMKQEIKTIDIMPSLEGKFELLTLIIVTIIMSLLSYGISKLMQPKKPKTAETNPSYLMDGTQNLAKQGLPIPLGYGRMMVGSLVVSQAIRYRDIDYKTLEG